MTSRLCLVQLTIQNFISKVSIFATTLAIVFGVGALANGLYQSERIGDAVRTTEENDAKREKRLDEYFDVKEAKTASVKNALDEEDVLYATIYLDADALGNNISAYKAVIEFNVRFPFSGSTTAILSGYMIQYDKNFTDTYCMIGLGGCGVEKSLMPGSHPIA
jgi:hypothetical protein